MSHHAQLSCECDVPVYGLTDGGILHLREEEDGIEPDLNG